ncbi:unnamed protein product [Gongylonema pulchrum]|uniref:Uncharacterized protein n=1 Tax=Gongylonema pulchrum TaxID=637853 RepID=A0A183DJX0_9BILA|nr:unnamed protein product [Gongylonema pulchrum]
MISACYAPCILLILLILSRTKATASKDLPPLKKDSVGLKKEEVTKKEATREKKEGSAKKVAQPKKEKEPVREVVRPKKEKEPVKGVVPVKKQSPVKKEPSVKKEGVAVKKEALVKKEGMIFKKEKVAAKKEVVPETQVTPNTPSPATSESSESPAVVFKFMVPGKVAAQVPSQATSENKKEVVASTEGMLDDDEPVIVSGPACQALEIIRAKGLLNSGAKTERENEIIRLYFAGKGAREQEQEAHHAIEKAIDLAVTRAKSEAGITGSLYDFLTYNRSNAIALMIDAMKYRKKDFLPDVWDIDRTPKK